MSNYNFKFNLLDVVWILYGARIYRGYITGRNLDESIDISIEEDTGQGSISQALIDDFDELLDSEEQYYVTFIDQDESIRSLRQSPVEIFRTKEQLRDHLLQIFENVS